MKIKMVILGMLVSAICIMAPISATDYSQIEKSCEMLLSNPENNLGIYAPEVAIGPDQVDIKYISTSTTTNAILDDIGYVVYVYAMIVKDFPGVGNLLITIQDLDEKTQGTVECQNAWVNGLDFNDTSDRQRLALKVRSTIKAIGAPPVNMAYDPHYAKLHPTSGNWLDDRSG